MNVAVITGASRGLGRSIALHLAQAGVGIVGTYKANESEAASVAAQVAQAGSRAEMLRLDVGDMEQIRGFGARLNDVLKRTFGKSSFDYLVNNAGTGLRAPFEEVTEDQFDELFAIHLKAPFFLTQVLLDRIADGGSVLNVSSGLARYTLPGSSAYATMKGGVEVMTRYMARELGARNITVNVIAPGAIATDFNNGAIRDDAGLRASVAAQIPLGRVGLPDDIGAAASALLVHAGHWVNGTCLKVSGGQNL